MNVDVWGDDDRTAHFSGYVPGTPGGRKGAVTACGLAVTDLKPRAWFDVGDKRGGVYYAKACDSCSAWLTT